MSKIHCLNSISQKGLDLLSSQYTFTNFEDAQAILVRSASLHDLALPSNLECIARAGAGVNNIPLDTCSEQGVVVFNTPGANANGVKELVLAGLLLSCRDILGGINWCKENAQNENVAKDAEKAKSNFAGIELAGKTLGVLGLGAIGAKVANSALSLGMKVIGYDPFISINAAWSLSQKVQHAIELDELLEKSDFITLHLPLTKQTDGFINHEIFSKMKNNAVLLNFAREPLVNNTDLKQAIETGIIKKYITDFPSLNVLQLENTIVIPHLGASTEESEDNCAKMAVLQCMDYIENGNIQNSVNFPSCNMGICKTASRIAILHQNIPNMISQITNVLATQNVNIANLINNSKNQVAYTCIDLENTINENTLASLQNIQGVAKVRIIK